MSLATNIQNLATRIATETKSLRTLINGNAADLSALTTTDKSNLVNALNELKGAIASASGINDGTTSTGSSWSSQHTQDQITAAITALINGAPTALDTLKEISDQLATDEGAASALTTAVGNRLRFDAAQTLTAPQQAQGQSNLSVYSQAQIGDPTTDFVATFVAGLA